MSKLSTIHRAVMAAAIAVPAGLFVPAVTGIGAHTAHAAVACIDVSTDPPGESNPFGPCPTTPDADTVVAINVCVMQPSDPGSDPAAGLGLTDHGVDVLGSTVVPLNQDTAEAWMQVAGPSGELEVAGTGIASQQQGC
jgi:hypothetical protein